MRIPLRNQGMTLCFGNNSQNVMRIAANNRPCSRRGRDNLAFRLGEEHAGECIQVNI